MGADGPRADRYTLRPEPPTAATYRELRAANDMLPRPDAAVEPGLAASVHAVTAVEDPTGETVGMARLLGDGAMVFQVSDVVVHPDHQGRGLGTRLTEALLDHVEETAPAGAEVNLFADVDGFYERFGFTETRPASKGMVRFLGGRPDDP